LELRRKLVRLIERTPIPAPRAGSVEQGTGGLAAAGQTGGDDRAGPLPTIASWVVWGWTTPPPPEPPEDRQRRRATVEAAGGNPDLVRVFVRGVTSESMVKQINAKVLDAAHGIVLAPVMTGEFREFRCGKVNDLRAMAYRLDIGPIKKIEKHKGILYVQLDPTELFERPRGWVSGPIPPLDFQQAGIPAAESVAVPAPPEPDDLRRRREDVRWEAGQNLEGVEVVLHGSTEELNALAYKRLKALKIARGLRSSNVGFLPATIHCDDVGDMRAFARKLDLGTIIQYDDENGVIGVVVDRAKLTAPESSSTTLSYAPKPPEPADVRLRRQAARREAGRDPDEIEITFLGLTDEQAKEMPQRLLAAQVSNRIGHRQLGDGAWWFYVQDVEDMRVVAEKIDLGTIIEYDEEQGRMVIQPDAAKLAVPPPPLSRPAPAASGSRDRFDPRSPPFAPRFGPRSGRRGPPFAPPEPDSP
jgi:hypothetical protein